MTPRQNELQNLLEAEQAGLRQDIWKMCGYMFLGFAAATVTGFATTSILENWLVDNLNLANVDAWINIFMEGAGVWGVIHALKNGVETAGQIAIGKVRIMETKHKIEHGQ